MASNINISIDDWILSEMVGDNNNNRSGRIKELIIKGYMYEQNQKENRPNLDKISQMEKGIIVNEAN
jgi:hypothetical protein